MPIDDERAFQIVRTAISRTRRGLLIVGLGMLAFGGLFASMLVRPDAVGIAPGIGGLLIIGSFALFFGLIGGAMCWTALVKQRPDRAPLMIALRNRPELVVWIYAQDVEVIVEGIRAPVGDRNVIAKFADGSTIALTVKKEQADELLAALAQLATDATTGFTPEREEQFNKEPRSLARSMQT